MNGLRSHIKNSKECFIRYPNTSNSVKKNSAAPRFFNPLLGLWISWWNTLSRVWYITSLPGNSRPFHWKQTFVHAQLKKYGLRNHRIQSNLFPRRANGETAICCGNKMFWKKKSETFLSRGNKKCFRNNFFVRAQTGKDLGNMFLQQCFRNNVSSFAGALKNEDPRSGFVNK